MAELPDIVIANWFLIKGTVSRYKRIFSNRNRMRIPMFNQERERCGFVTLQSRHLHAPGRPCLTSWSKQSAASFGEMDFAMILNEARRLVYLSFRYFAFFFRISCHHKVHWARLTDSYGRGTWHAVARVTLKHVTFCG